MARVFTPKDMHVVMTLLGREATGQTDLTVVDSADYISVGETVLATGYENTFNTINLVFGRLIVASRDYKARLTLMNELSTGEFTHLMRKISFYAKDPLPAGNFNTDLYTNLADGFTAGQNKDGNGDPQSTKSQWEQNTQPSVCEFFGGSDVWQNNITMYEDAVGMAFRDESEMAKFLGGYLQEHANDYETQRESWNRNALLQKIGQTFAMSSVMKGSCINLTKAFNDKFGTSYTSAQLRTTYLKEFTQFFVSLFKTTVDYMGERSTNYHYPMTKQINGTYYSILRHTPRELMRVYMYTPLFKDVESMVMPEIFNDEYLKLDTQFQGVTYWQSNYSDAVRPKVDVVPAVIDTDTSHTSTFGTQIKGNEVQLDYVVGLITDRDGLLTDMQIEKARTTPVEARKGYRNTWLSIAKNAIVTPLENCVLFYMADPSPSPTPTSVDLSINRGNVTYQNGETIELTETKKSTKSSK